MRSRKDTSKTRKGQSPDAQSAVTRAPRSAQSISSTAHTIAQVARYLAPSMWQDGGRPPRWPPDVFALTGTLLDESGAYQRVIERWPPKTALRTGDWANGVRAIGRDWRTSFIKNIAPPEEVRGWWQTLLDRADASVASIKSEDTLCEALLQLTAAADEASAGVGVPSGEPADEYEKFAHARLRTDSSLCHEVHKDVIRVLPKMHTPQTGITFRSLTHHLALCHSGEIDVSWEQTPTGPERPSINLLLVPLPRIVQPSQFSAADPRTGSLTNMPSCYGFFNYSLNPIVGASANAHRLLDDAEQIVGKIDGAVFPELALRVEDEQAIRNVLESRNAFLVAGVGEGATPDTPGKNYVVFNLPVSASFSRHFRQSKHHRWILDKRQIVQYGLGGLLNVTCGWWEHIQITNRELHFVSMRPWLTMCVLICEDLARPDPAAEIVRAVGPNLVIAVLMDGPQLAARWSARYATVLADDPGSSVLTLTSEGMARLSRPGHAISARPPVVALWKDAKTGVPVEIELPTGADALVLCLSVEYHEEWSADGRSDEKASGYPVLVGIHPVWRDRTQPR